MHWSQRFFFFKVNYKWQLLGRPGQIFNLASPKVRSSGGYAVPHAVHGWEMAEKGLAGVLCVSDMGSQLRIMK